MKKLYTVLAAAVAFAGASAATTLVADNAVAQQLRENLILEAADASIQKAPAKVVAAPVDGEWNVVGKGTYTEDLMCEVSPELGLEPGAQWEVTFEQSASEPAWYRTIIYNENSPLIDIMEAADESYFYFNVANPDKVFTTPYTAYEAFDFYNANEDCADWTKILQNPSVVLDNQKYGKLQDGVVSFPAKSFMYHDKEEGYLLWVNTYAFMSFTLPGATAPESWRTLGSGHFSDGIFGTLFGGTEEQSEPFEYDVTVCQSTTNANVYSVPSMFGQLELSGWNYAPARFIFDTTDPEDVDINEQSSGWSSTDNGLISIICRHYFQGFDKTKDACKFADNKLQIPATGILYHMVLPQNGVPTEGYWSFQDALPSTLDIPAGAVDNVVIADEAAPVKFYNLAGVEVSKPAAGIYIMRQGNKASKVFIR